MVWGILGAMDTEVALLKQQMKVEKEDTVYGTTYYFGELAGKQVIVGCCGIGKILAALCAHVMLREFHADVLVNVGVAGAMAPELNVLDLVIGTEVLFHDFDQGILLDYYPHKALFPTDAKLASLCQAACQKLGNVNYRTGRIATGDVFVNDPALKRAIWDKCQPACVEMEGGAIGEVATLAEKPFLVIRTMSDTADDQADNLYEDFKDRAAHQSASILIQMLELA